MVIGNLNRFALLFFLSFSASLTAATSDSGVYLLPLNCAELLPDSRPFNNFLEGVARSSISKEPKLARRIFRVMSFRDKISELAPRDQNPIDLLVRKTLCFYREQREPLKAVPVDDEKFLAYLRPALGELEKKVEEAAFELEYERLQKEDYEKKVRGNEAVIFKMERQIDDQVDQEFQRISKAAKRKIKNP